MEQIAAAGAQGTMTDMKTTMQRRHLAKAAAGYPSLPARQVLARVPLRQDA
jgi:hypothetical protein